MQDTSDTFLSTYILAGGRSSRMGTDKARLPYISEDGKETGKPWISHLADLYRQIARLDSHQLNVVGSQQNQYADLGLNTIADSTPHLGPLSGLYTAITHFANSPENREWLLLSACDHTLIKPAWINLLIDRCTKLANNSEIIAVIFKDSSGRWEPMPAIYHLRSMPLIAEERKNGQNSFQRFLNRHQERIISLSLPADWPKIAQINTPGMLNAWQNGQK